MNRPLTIVREASSELHAPSSRAVAQEALVAALHARDEAVAQRTAEIVLEGIARALAPQRTVLDRNDLAAALGISLSSLDRLRAEPSFPELRIGDAPRFLLRDVLAHLKRAAK